MTFVNEGLPDRMIRLVAGIALAYFAWMAWPGTAGLIFLVVSAIAIVTGLVGWCPLYALFNVSTNKRAGA